VRIGLLGPLQVHDGAGRPVRVGGYRVRALLILLALDANRVVPAYSLIARLWGDERPADAANALQSLVSRLRGALRQAGLGDGVIEFSPAGYRLAVRPEEVDAIAFEAAARAGGQAFAAGDAVGAARVLREALAAWRGPALADVADEGFAIAQAARLEELRASATLDRIEADLLVGEGGGLVGELRAITAADPLAERPRALLMRALSAAGRQADALAVYHQVRELLADRLGVDPSARLEQVYLQILRHDPGARSDSPERSVVPPQAAPRPSCGLTSFVGRDEDVSGVLKKLAEERLVTLTGPGGVGKTRLAAEVLARLGNPACFAELAPVTQPAEVPYAVLDAMGIGERRIARKTAEAGPAAPLDRLCDALSGRDMLVVLDNCEHVVDAAAGLAGRLLADCPRVRILATSREPLRIGGETLWVVSPLPVPPDPTATAAPTASLAGTDISEILRYPAIQLLRDRAAAVLPGFELNEANAAAIAGVCRVLDGMPLAIELAAVWLRTLTPAQLAERLADRFALLTSGSRTALPRHQTLRAVVDWSWDLLSGPERVLARRLAIFPAGAALAGAEQVCADNLLPRSAILPALSGLVSKSILTAAEEEPGGSGPRYRMLETVRAYGLERLAEAGESDRFRNAMADYYLDFAETADPRLRTADQVRWFRELGAEQDNLHASLSWAIARRDSQTALRLVRALGYYWVQRGGGEGDTLAREVLALDPPQATTLRIAEARAICALLAAGWSWDIDSVRGQLNEAIACLGRWADSYASFHPLAALVETMIAMYDGDPERSLAQLERYLTVDDPWLRAMALLYRASYSSTLGRLDAATEADCAAALAGFRKLGEKWGTAITLTQLAEFTELRADHAAAIAELAEAAALGRELGTWGDLSYIDARLAIIRARAGDLAHARAEFDQAERTAAERGGHNDTDRWLAFMRAELAWWEGDLRAAADCCTATLAAIEDNTAAWWQSLRAQLKARLAMVVLAQGDTEHARELLTDAWRAAGNWVERPPLAVVLDALAVYVLHRGQDGAEFAARLLGAAHGMRGVFDEGSLDAPAARAAARQVLGAPAFDAAYQRGRELGYDDALTFAGQILDGVASPAGRGLQPEIVGRSRRIAPLLTHNHEAARQPGGPGVPKCARARGVCPFCHSHAKGGRRTAKIRSKEGTRPGGCPGCRICACGQAV
jgi:predicted ATPase/DNA-binding SARP family transcriptional activator